MSEKLGLIGDCSNLSRIEKPTLKQIIEGINELRTMGVIVEKEHLTFPMREITDFMFRDTVDSILDAMRETINLTARGEHFFQRSDDEEHLLCHECHRVFESGEIYWRFIVGHPYMISGDYCTICYEVLRRSV